MTEFVISLDELDGVIEDMRHFDSDAEQICADVGATISRLHVSWTGDAADAQRHAHEEWIKGAAEMRSAINDLNTAGQRAHSNYSSAARTNTRMWL